MNSQSPFCGASQVTSHRSGIASGFLLKIPVHISPLTHNHKPMPGPLLPFAFDQSRAAENVPPLNLSSSQKSSKRRYESINNEIGNEENDKGLPYSDPEYAEDVDNYRLNKFKTNDSEISTEETEMGPRRFFYSSLNSSSSVLTENRSLINRMDQNTSSTVLNFNPSDIDIESSDPNYPSETNNQEMPSSPIMQSQQDLFQRNDPLRSDAFDDLVSCNKTTEMSMKQSIPSSPTLLPTSLSQSNAAQQDGESIEHTSKSVKFQRPKLNKVIHSISRHGSTFTEPTRKKQRMPTVDFHQRSKRLSTPPLQFSKTEEFAINRDGQVYGYNLETDQLPENYSPTLYDEPNYFVVKNTQQQLSLISKALDELFEHGITTKNYIATLNLQKLGLNSLPDSICDVKDYLGFSDGEILKPIIHIDASQNNIRGINPKIFQIERLEMLSLRSNKIARLSGCIEHSHSLKSLNLAMNKFKFLPHNLLNLENLEVLATNGNPMIPYTSVDKYFSINEELLRLYSIENNTKQFLDTDKQIKYFSRIHWLENTKRVSENGVHANLMSRSLTTLQDMCYDDNGNINDWASSFSGSTSSTATTQENIEKTKMKLRKKKQSHIESQTPWTPKLSELCLRQISKYFISQSEVDKWKESTSEFVYKRAMSSLIYGAHGETCGFCNETCVESVADMLEWWDLKGSKSVTIKRRFCSKNCAVNWMDILNHFKANETNIV